MKKEEQKQHLIDMVKDDEDLGLYDEIQPKQIWNKEKMEGIKQLIQDHKQKTLEEAAKNYANYNEQMHSAIKEAVIFGAKWQMERSYNEEEVLPLLEILQKCKEYFLLKTDKYSDERADAIIDVMEQFKKK